SFPTRRSANLAAGEPKSALKVVGTVGKRNTGTTIRFWPNEKYFDSPTVAVPRLRHVLRAKAVLCPGLAVVLEDEKSGEREEWCYSDGIRGYLTEALGGIELLPREPFTGSMEGTHEAVEWAVHWLPE